MNRVEQDTRIDKAMQRMLFFMVFVSPLLVLQIVQKRSVPLAAGYICYNVFLQGEKNRINKGTVNCDAFCRTIYSGSIRSIFFYDRNIQKNSNQSGDYGPAIVFCYLLYNKIDER